MVPQSLCFCFYFGSGYVLQVDPSLQPGTSVVIHQQWSKDDDQLDRLDLDQQSMSGKPPSVNESINSEYVLYIRIVFFIFDISYTCVIMFIWKESVKG